MISNFLIILICGITLLLFHYNNQYRNIERYYYKNNKLLFLVLELCMLILVLAALYHSRFIVFNHIVLPWIKNKIKKFMK